MFGESEISGDPVRWINGSGGGPEAALVSRFSSNAGFPPPAAPQVSRELRHSNEWLWVTNMWFFIWPEVHVCPKGGNGISVRPEPANSTFAVSAEYEQACHSHGVVCDLSTRCRNMTWPKPAGTDISARLSQLYGACNCRLTGLLWLGEYLAILLRFART